MNYAKTISLIACASLMMLPGCRHKPVNRTRPLDILNPQAHYRESQNNVSMSIRKLGSKECIKLFGSSGRRLVSKIHKPLVPLYISITNTSEQTYTLDPKNISLSLVDAKKVANRLKPNIGLRVIGAAAGGTLLAGTAIAVGMTMMIPGAQALALTGIAIGASSIPIFFIGTPIASGAAGINAANKRLAINQDIYSKTLTHEVSIEPNQTLDTLIFTPLRGMKRNFNITLENKDSHEESIIFDVELKKK